VGTNEAWAIPSHGVKRATIGTRAHSAVGIGKRHHQMTFVHTHSLKGNKMETFELVFHNVPVSGTTVNHWNTQNRAALNGAAQKIKTHGANPWVFTADECHFQQFAGAAEYAAIKEMTTDEIMALVHWAND
jgi:hypothetical protein